jgi:uncharacterized protein (TIGR03437 family)
MRSHRVLLVLLVQTGLLLAETGQRQISTDNGVRESSPDGRQAQTELVSGSTVSFALPAFSRPTLFIGDFGYLIRVPQGATELRIRLATGSDIELYANFGSDPRVGTAGQVISDHSTESIPTKDLRITTGSSPQLRAGTYFIGLAAFDFAAPNTGTIQVTITNPNPLPVNDLAVSIGAEDNSSCPTTKKLPVTVRDPAGNLISGLSASNFTVLEGTTVKNAGVTCPSAGQCTLSYPPTDATRSAEVEVRVNVNNQRTGSARKTVGPCTASPGGGGAARTVTGLRLEMGSVTSANVFNGNGSIWGTLPEPTFSLGVSLPDAAAPLLNASNRSVNLQPGSYFLYGEPGAIGSHARMTLNWSDGATEQATFATSALATAATWSRVSGSSGLSMGATGLTNLNKVGPNTGLAAGGTADFVFQISVSGSAGGALTVAISNEDNTACPVTKKLVVSVVDGSGQAVTGLNSSNFALTENQVARPVNVTCSSSGGSGSAGSGAAVAIVIDTSGSLSGTDLTNEKAAAVSLVNSLGASDQVAVYNFDSVVTKKQAFTTNKQLAITAINSLSIGGSTALYQAVFNAAQDLGTMPGRRVMVLMTDGSNNVSGKTIDEAIAGAKAAQAAIYAVGFGSGINDTVLQRMASETGGTFSRGATSAELQALLQSVASNITSTCEVSYTPADPSREADVSVVVTAGTRTGQGTRRVSACQGSGGGTPTGVGWAVTPGCNYFVTPLSAAPPPAQSTGIIRVTTADTCAWNAHSEVPWVRVTAVRNANGRGSGAVDYIVSPNPDPVTRTGRVITAAQVHTIVQAAGSSCSITISPTTARTGPGGGSSSILISATTPACAWTARSNDAWLKAGTPSSGTGPGRLAYTVDPNPTAAVRTATMTVNGQTFTLTQEAGSIPGTPTVTENGIVNSASGIPPSLPGGALAQGSFFTIFASGVGPTPPQQAEQFPLPVNLGGTRVQIRQGTRTVDCYLVFTSNTQINGIIPSNAPLGNAEMIVTYNGNASRAVPVRIAQHNFGIFATSQGRGPGIIQNFQTQLEQPLNTRSASAKPRQVIILWGTGAGPIAAPDNVAPPAGNLPFPFEMTIGGKPARLLYNGRAPCCSGVDQIVAEVPDDAPQGCYVPVQVKAGDVWSNVVTMAIEPNGQTCQDVTNPASTITSTGGKVGVVMLTRLSATINSASTGEQKLDADLGVAAFPEMTAAGDLGFNMLTSMPPVGTCQAFAGVRDISDLLGGAFGGPLQTTGAAKMLDAGAMLQVSSSGRTANLERSTNGTYLGLLGGSIPLPGTPAMVPLDAGTFTIAGTGGPDVGAFNASITLRPPISWTNRTQLGVIDRKTPFRVDWTGGTAGESVLVLGYGTDQANKASSGFLCMAPSDSGSFTVPAAAMANLPAVQGTGDLGGKFGLLGLFSFRSAGQVTPFQAPGLSLGLVIGAQIEARSIEIK